MQYCKLITSTNVNEISPESINNGGAWPAKLVTGPFRYKHNNITYDLSVEGLYRLHVPAQNTTNIVVYNNDLIQLLSSLTYLIVPGQTDTTKTVGTVQSKAYTSRVNLLCEAACDFMKYQLSLLNIPARKVRVLRADTPNGFYDGHVMLEVGANKMLCDAQLGLTFNNNASLKDVCPADNITNFTKLSAFKVYNPAETHYNNVYHHASTVDLFLYDEQAMLEFQRNIMQIPGIDHTDGLTYFYVPAQHAARTSWVLSLSAAYRVVDHATWLNMFY